MRYDNTSWRRGLQSQIQGQQQARDFIEGHHRRQTAPTEGGSRNPISDGIGWLVKQVYDTDKGGFQLSGIIGAVLGGLMAFKLTGGGGFGALGLVALALGPIMGAVGGNKLSGMFNFSGGFGGKSRNLTPPAGGVIDQAVKRVDAQEQAREEALAAAIARGAGEEQDRPFTAADTGNLSPGGPAGGLASSPTRPR